MSVGVMGAGDTAVAGQGAPKGAEVDWEARYRSGVAPWERPSANAAFLAWRAGGILTPCRILVPCAGRSHEPALLAEHDFDVTIVDLAPTALEAQRARLGDRAARCQLVLKDLFAWEPAEPFEAIYDQTCLCALSPHTWAAYEDRAWRWLVPGGRLLVLFMQTNGRPGGPPYDCPMDLMRRLFSPHRWAWPDKLETPVYHPDGLHEQPAVLRRL